MIKFNISISQIDAKEGGPIEVWYRTEPKEGQTYGQYRDMPKTRKNIVALNNATNKFIAKLSDLHEEIEKELQETLEFDGEILSPAEQDKLEDELYELNKKNKPVRDVVYY